jgi:hypothetical protein
VEKEVEVDKLEEHVVIHLKSGEKYEYSIELDNQNTLFYADLTTGELYNTYYGAAKINPINYINIYTNLAAYLCTPSLNDRSIRFKILDKNYEIHTSDIQVIESEVKVVGKKKVINRTLERIKE